MPIDLQSRLRDLVTACPLLAGRQVLVEDKNNLTNVVEAALIDNSLAVVVAWTSGELKEGSLRGRDAWLESFEVVIHRSLFEDETTPSTVAVRDSLRRLIRGQLVDPALPHGPAFKCSRHETREAGDGNYCRIITVTALIPDSFFEQSLPSS